MFTNVVNNWYEKHKSHMRTIQLPPPPPQKKETPNIYISLIHVDIFSVFWKKYWLYLNDACKITRSNPKLCSRKNKYSLEFSITCRMQRTLDRYSVAEWSVTVKRNCMFKRNSQYVSVCSLEGPSSDYAQSCKKEDKIVDTSGKHPIMTTHILCSLLKFISLYKNCKQACVKIVTFHTTYCLTALG